MSKRHVLRRDRDAESHDVRQHDRPTKNDLHPTMKPVGLVERAIRNSSKARNIVLDPFAGSGTTLMAAEATGRTAALVELDPGYCDVIVRRWTEQTGGTAVRRDGAVFDALAREPSRDEEPCHARA